VGTWDFNRGTATIRGGDEKRASFRIKREAVGASSQSERKFDGARTQRENPIVLINKRINETILMESDQGKLVEPKRVTRIRMH